MKDAWKVFSNDLRTLRSNVMASLIVCGVILIPLTFTWFNVLASWAPLENTQGLKVAVASEDKGFTSNIIPTPVNVGEEVLSALRANDQLDWVITSKDAAIDGTKSGEYYAAIILPETFSEDILYFYASGATPTTIELYSNEKKNALAPKITDQGAQGLSHQVAEEFTRTLGDVSLGFVASVSEFMTQDDASAVFQRIEARASWVESQLRTSAGTARAFAGLLDSSVPLVESAERIINTPLPEVPSINTNVDLSTDELTGALDQTITSYDAIQKRVDELYANASATHADQVKVLKDLAAGVGENVARFEELRTFVANEVSKVAPEAAQSLLISLDEAIAAQKAVQQRLLSAAENPAPGKPDLSVIDDAKKALGRTRTSDLPNTIDSLKESLTKIKQNLSFSHAEIDVNTEALTNGSDAVQELAQKLDDNAAKFGKVRQAMAAASSSGDLEAVAALVGSQPDALAASIASPVVVEREVVFPVDAFGVGMAPLYTALALWLGALLAGVTFKTDIPASGREAVTKYFGRFGLFALIGCAQSTFVGLGLLNFVKIEPVHPFLLMLALWVSSTVFMLIIYTFVVAFSNAGKALGVLLLVFQISASGGAYPLELLPHWFQNLSPWLPATYTIHAFQAATAGVYDADYWKALGMLLVFAAPILLLGTVLRKPLAGYNAKLTATLEGTKLM